MRLLFPIVILLGAFAIGVMLRRRVQRFVQEPSCGKCGYCVRGLEHMTCPECGSDLRVVGILQPGTQRPLTSGMKLLGWTLFTPLLALTVGGFLTPLVGPQWLTTSQRRVIFSQSPYCNTIVTANAIGKRLIFGYPKPNAAPTTPTPTTMENLFLSTNTPKMTTMDVNLRTKQFRFTDAQNKVITGPFDAQAVEKWLNNAGFTDPRVADRAQDIFGAVEEMSTPAGNGFTQFAPDPMRNGMASGMAHPTFTTSVPSSNELTWIAWGLLAVVIWSIGFLVLRRGATFASPGSAALRPGRSAAEPGDQTPLPLNQ